MTPQPREQTVTFLRRRWLDPTTAAILFSDAARFFAGNTLGYTLDLRGVEVGLDGPLANVRLANRGYCDLNISHGKGTIIILNARVQGLIADRFAFDRASRFSRAIVASSRFVRAHLRFDATDVEFLDCDFGGSTFAGGFNEYGYRRCKFVRCSFSGIVWRNTYLRACQFCECTYGDGRIVKSILAGIRVSGSPLPSEFLAGSEVRSLYVEGESVPDTAV